jgi:hypothetical protein
MLSFLERIPFLDSILFDLDEGALISLLGLTKFLGPELFAIPVVGVLPVTGGVNPLK